MTMQQVSAKNVVRNYYDAHYFEHARQTSSFFHRITVDHIIPSICQRLDDKHSSNTEPLQVLDLGCADGQISLGMFSKIHYAIRQHVMKNELLCRPLVLTGVDLPYNDFSRLFQRGFSSAFVNASGTSMFEQVLPSGSVDVAFSANATQHLSKTPDGAVPLEMHFTIVGNSRVDSSSMRLYEEQARNDWSSFLVSRARELKRGGLLFTVNLFDDNSISGCNGSLTSARRYNLFNRIWLDMLKSGDITTDEYEKTQFPEYFRSESELCAPLLDKSSAAYGEGLRLIERFQVVSTPPEEPIFQEKDHVDAFVGEYVPATRAWSETIFTNALHKERQDRERIMEKYYEQFEEEIRRNPAEYYGRTPRCVLVMEKVGK